MDEVSVTEFKATCLRLIETVRLTGKSVLILKNGKPAAVLGAPPSDKDTQIVSGKLKGRGSVLGDIVGSVSSEDEWIS